MSDERCEVAAPPPVVVSLRGHAPYDGRALVGFLERRAVAGIEQVDGLTYSRSLVLPHGPAALRLDVSGDETAAEATATLWLADPADLAIATERCRQLLDLDARPVEIAKWLADDPHLAASLRRHPGLRIPGHVDGFEVAVRAVVGQQISVVGAQTILGRLVSDHGEPYPGQGGLPRLFPTPEAMADVDPETLPMPRSRGRSLVGLAAAVACGDVVLDRSVERADVRRSLLALAGIGPWTADYIALRALGDPDVFMATDLGVRHALARLGIAHATAEITARWAPWRSYALMHVWQSLEQVTT